MENFHDLWILDPCYAGAIANWSPILVLLMALRLSGTNLRLQIIHNFQALRLRTGKYCCDNFQCTYICKDPPGRVVPADVDQTKHYQPAAQLLIVYRN